MRQINLTLSGVLLVICEASASTVYSIDFPELGGTYEYPSDPYTANQTSSFDFGVQFSSINSVEVIITASGYPATYQRCIDGNCTIGETSEPILEYVILPNPGYPPPLLEFNKLTLTQTPTTYINTVEGTFDYLLGGVGRMNISIPVLITGQILDGEEFEYLSPLTLEVFDVALRVDATVVPLPSTVWLFGSSLLGLVGLAQRKKAA